MASFLPRQSLTDNQIRWFVAGIAINTILIPQIRPFVEQEVDKEYNKLKEDYKIHEQIKPGLKKWPSTRKNPFVYKNINENANKAKGNYDYRVLSAVDFARLYVQNHMAKFNAFDDHCDASAVLLLLGHDGVPVFSRDVQDATGKVITARNDWAHPAFPKWDSTKFQETFKDMQHLVTVMPLPPEDKGKLLGQLKDCETEGIQRYMNSPVDPVLLQLFEQNITSLQDVVNNISVEFEQEKVKLQQELQNVATSILKEMRERIDDIKEDISQRFEQVENQLLNLQEDTSQRIESVESRTEQVENQVQNLQEDISQRFEQVENQLLNLQGDTSQRFESVESRTGQVENQVQNLKEDTSQRIESVESRTEQVENQVQNLQGDTDQRIESVESRTGQVENQVQNLQEDTSQRIESVESRTEQVENQVQNLQGDTDQRIESVESRTVQVENQMHNLQEKVDDLTSKSQESASFQDPVANPEKFVELIRRDYKGAVLCPFPWCEDELQMKLSNMFTRLQIVSRTKERSTLTNDPVNMTDVFKPHPDCDKPRVVLIEGNPGMGKTTYCQKLAYDWSEGKISPEASFPEVEMLLLLKCRDMQMKTANIEEAIDDQLLPRNVDKKEKENFFHFIRSNQSRILLVLDGLDELRQDLVQGFLPLIRGKDFYDIYLILTARREAGMRIRRYCDTLLEIVGFTCDDADDHVKRYFSNHEDKSLADEMIKQLNEDKQLRELTVNPLNTALLCLLYEERRAFPSKRTKLYDDLVSCALRRYSAKRGVSLDDDDPLERYADQLNQLGRVAFEALLKNQMYFSQDEMKCQSEDFILLCFLSREPSVSKIKPTPCYAFTHKTFQEYFAALYLAHLVFTGDKGKEKLLDQLSPFDNWQVWEFLFTIMARKSTEMAVIVVSRLCASVSHHERPQRLIDVEMNLNEIVMSRKLQYYGELHLHHKDDHLRLDSRDDELNDVVIKILHLIAECEDGENELKDYQTKMVHVLAQFPVKMLHLKTDTRYCSVYSEYLKFNSTLTTLSLEGARLDPLLLATIEHVFYSNQNLVHFCYARDQTQYDDLRCNPFAIFADSYLNQRIGWIQSFGTKVLQLDQLTHLLICDTWISDRGTQVLAEVLHTNRALTHLNLDDVVISDLGAGALANVLHSNCTLTHLSLRRSFISDIGAAALARGLQSNPVVVYLDLYYSKCGDSGAEALAQALESNCALKYLDLSSVCMPSDEGENLSEGLIGPLGGSALARALRLNCTLTCLDLTFNNIGESGAVALGEALQKNCTLTELYLYHNGIGDSGAEALGKALQKNHTLTDLSVASNGISDLGAAAVAMALQSNGSLLTRLDLSENNISSSGGIAIAEALQSNSSLTHLGLEENRIGFSGAAAIAEAFQSNSSLKHLELDHNKIESSGAVAIAKALKSNRTLTYLSLRYNSIGSKGKESLQQIDQSNCIVKYQDF